MIQIWKLFFKEKREQKKYQISEYDRYLNTKLHKNMITFTFHLCINISLKIVKFQNETYN